LRIAVDAPTAPPATGSRASEKELGRLGLSSFRTPAVSAWVGIREKCANHRQSLAAVPGDRHPGPDCHAEGEVRRLSAEITRSKSVGDAIARNVNSRSLAAQTPRDRAGALAISRRLLSRKAPRRSLVSDARWRSSETGTTKTGTSTSGNWRMSSFDRSKGTVSQVRQSRQARQRRQRRRWPRTRRFVWAIATRSLYNPGSVRTSPHGINNVQFLHSVGAGLWSI
jgi:hypothetical protein